MEDLLREFSRQTYPVPWHFGIVSIPPFISYRRLMAAPGMLDKTLLLEAGSTTH